MLDVAWIVGRANEIINAHLNGEPVENSDMSDLNNSVHDLISSIDRLDSTFNSIFKTS